MRPTRKAIAVLTALVLLSSALHCALAKAEPASAQLPGEESTPAFPERLGPEGAHVRFMVAAGTGQRVVYVATLRAGLYKLLPGDAEWQPLGFEGEDFTSIAANPRNPDQLICCLNNGRVWRTTDGGKSWMVVEALHHVTSFTYSSSGTTIYALQNATVVSCSLDGGQTWTKRSEVDTDGRGGTLFVDPRTGCLILGANAAGLENGLGFARYSTDGGRTWKRCNYEGILAMNASPDAKAIWASGLVDPLVSTDGGRTWRPFDPGFDVTWTPPVFLTDGAGGTSGAARMLAVGDASTGTEAAVSDDGGKTWIPTTRPAGIPTALVYDGSRAILSVDGLIWSSKDGLTWDRCDRGIRGQYITAVGATGSGLPEYVGTAEGRIYKLVDGDQYVEITGPWTGGRQEVARIEVSEQTPGLAFVQMAQTFSQFYLDGRLSVLYRTIDGGQSWEEVTVFEVNPVNDIAFDTRDADKVWAAVGTAPSNPNSDENPTKPLAPGIYVSTDKGVTFALAGLSVAPTCVALSPSGDLYVGSWDGVYVKRAASDSWVRSFRGLPSRQVRSIAVSPFDDGIIHAATSGGLALSRDGGLSWEVPVLWEAGDAAGRMPEQPLQVTVHPRVEGLVLARGTGVAWYSPDNGIRWSELPWLPSTSVTAVVPDAGRGAIVVTGGAGMIHLTEMPDAGGVMGLPERHDLAGVTWSKGFEFPHGARPDQVFTAADGLYIRAGDLLYFSVDGCGWENTFDFSTMGQGAMVEILGAGGMRESVLYAARSIVGGGMLPRTEVLRSTNRGRTWEKTGELPGMAGYILCTVAMLKSYSFAVGSSNPDVLLACAGLGNKYEVWSSQDGGATWAMASGLDGTPGYAPRVVATAGSPTIWAVSGTELFSSSDGGRTFLSSGKVYEPTLLATRSALCSGNQISRDGGASWQDLIAPVVRNESFHVLAVSPDNDRRLLGGWMHTDGRPWGLGLSDDGGITWMKIGYEIGNPVIAACGFLPGGKVFVVTRDHTGRSTVYVMKDLE